MESPRWNTDIWHHYTAVPTDVVIPRSTIELICMCKNSGLFLCQVSLGDSKGAYKSNVLSILLLFWSLLLLQLCSDSAGQNDGNTSWLKLTHTTAKQDRVSRVDPKYIWKQPRGEAKASNRAHCRELQWQCLSPLNDFDHDGKKSITEDMGHFLFCQVYHRKEGQ